MQERIQKFLSTQGVASRRKAEEFIAGGHVTVNGKAAKLGDKLDPDTDVVKVFGKRIRQDKQFLYLVLNKPKGYVVSKRDPQGRKTVFGLFRAKYAARSGMSDDSITTPKDYFCSQTMGI
jgi:23S rRNA pseudouridine2605 synthase